MADERILPESGKMLRRGVRRAVVSYSGLRRSVDQPGWYPEDDDHGIISGAGANPGDRALVEMMAGIETLPGATEIRRIRQKLKLSQRRAGEILGGGPRAFQKYESGEIVVSRPMANLLQLLDHDPSRLKELTRDQAA